MSKRRHNYRAALEAPVGSAADDVALLQVMPMTSLSNVPHLVNCPLATHQGRSPAPALGPKRWGRQSTPKL